jgi:hypothetical protein
MWQESNGDEGGQCLMVQLVGWLQELVSEASPEDSPPSAVEVGAGAAVEQGLTTELVPESAPPPPQAALLLPPPPPPPQQDPLPEQPPPPALQALCMRTILTRFGTHTRTDSTTGAWCCCRMPHVRI